MPTSGPKLSDACLEDENWQVPKFEHLTFREPSNKYALVIPVINEGKKFRNQLKLISELQLAIDVIVADGGSDDGSTEPTFLSSTGVTALLIKKDVGRLSSQLRIAYYWCVSKGYDGVVTIDGNGKDDLSGIGGMMRCLDEGFDYVQGSRYLKHGGEKNTPVDRIFGNRFIHAPLLSLASGFKFSDTTNGFRAYSLKFLLHPDTQPFRDLFQNYELLFYLTTRAAQIGLRVVEIPVWRIYPETGSIPTKIKGLTARLAILKQTISAAFGHYKPK